MTTASRRSWSASSRAGSVAHGSWRPGDTLTLRGRRLRVVGLTDRTASWMTPLVFVTRRDAAAMQGAPDSAGFVLVRGDGLPADRLAARLQQQFPRLNVMTRAELAANDQALAIAALALAAGVAAEPRSEPDYPPAERPVRRRGRSDAR